MTESKHTDSEPNPSLAERYRDLFVPASATKRLFDYLTANPFCGDEELVSASDVSSVQTQYPEVAEAAKLAVWTRTHITQTYSELSAQTAKNQKQIATLLYEGAQEKDVHGATGTLKMGFLNNPFALVIIANKADFQNLHTEDAAGVYMRATKISLPDGSTYYVPFIAISDSGLHNRFILDHENRHSHCDKFRQAVAMTGRPHLWGEVVDPSPNERVDHAWFAGMRWRGLGRREKQDIIQDPNWDWMMKYSTSYIKDEVLVRLMTQFYPEVVLERHGGYDILDKHFFMMQFGKSFQELFWTGYSGIVDPEIKAAQKSINAYQSFGFEEKAGVLPWMLMRVPLGNWVAAMNEAGITSEVEIIEQISKVRERRVSGSITAVRMEDPKMTRMKANQDSLVIPELIDYLQRMS